MLDPQVLRVHECLLSSGLIEPVRLGGDDERRWLDCDLASLAESRLGERVDPWDMDAGHRARFEAHATDEPQSSLKPRGRYEQFYWLLEGGERAGTMGLSTMLLGGSAMHLTSLYVRPAYRGRALGRRALAQVQQAIAKEDQRLRLDASWCWQPAVRFYMSAGMWLCMWKRELTFAWYPDVPRPLFEVGAEAASLSVQVDGEEVVLLRARRAGNVLVMDEQPDYSEDERIGDAYWMASTHLALALAMHGWPLVRSQKEWDEGHYSDADSPESLAHRIQIWEAWANHRGWPPRTPRIPGLEYPTWQELEASWK